MPGERTEKASLKRREDERKKGHAFQSQDLTSAAILLGTFGTLKALGSSLSGTLENIVSGYLRRIPDLITGPKDMFALLASAVLAVASILVPVFAVSAAVSVALTLAQTRLLVTTANLSPKFERINPIKGIKQLLSLRSLVEMIKSLLKMTAILAIIVADVYPKLPQIEMLFDASLTAALSYIAGLAVDIGFKAGGVMLAIGVADFFYQWWEFERGIMMTKQELKDEYKEIEGNPQIKQHIRSLQRKAARMRMMQAVPKADVVVRNPTHYAVAIKYDAEKDRAPFVVAKGANAVALRIVDIAEKNGVYVTENKPLAQGLYKSTEVGSEIPIEFYKAVAGVLAYLYNLRRAGRT